MQYTFNYYLSGVLNYLKYDLPHRARLQTYYHTNNGSNKSKSSVENAKLKCAECDLDNSLIMCLQCDSPLCMPCFNNVHRQAKVLRSHQYEEIDGLNKEINMHLKLIRKNYQCDSHNSLNLFCVDCNLPCCTICFNDTHNGHTLITLKQQVLIHIFPIYIDFFLKCQIVLE